MGAGDDCQFRVTPGFQGRADLADAFGNGDQVRGFAAELRRQQGVFDGQGGHAGTFELDDGAHDVECVAIAMVGVGDHRQLGDAADAGGLLGELAEGDQGEVWGTQYLQRRDRPAENTHFKPQVRRNARRHRVEDRRRVVAGVGCE